MVKHKDIYFLNLQNDSEFPSDWSSSQDSLHSITRSMGSIPDLGTKIPHAMWHAHHPSPPHTHIHTHTHTHTNKPSDWKHFFFFNNERREEKCNLLLLLLLSPFSRVRLCDTPQTAAHQAPPSLGFSRQEHWSGLPFPSPMHESEK